MQTPSDEQLMLKVRDGDPDAFEQIVLRHQAAVWRTAHRFVSDEAEAEDLAQKAFLRILDAAPRYKPTASFRTFLFRVLTRLCLDHLEKKLPQYVDQLPERPDESSSPEHLARLGERDAAIQDALNELPTNQRMAVVLRYFEGMGAADCAEALGVSAKAVERLLARARGALEPRLKDLLEY